MIIGVDFDNTLVQETSFPCFNYKLKENAKEVILRLSKLGVNFRLCSARRNWYRIIAIIFIIRNKLPTKTYIFNRKPVADLYIDDRNIDTKNIDWLEIERKIKCILLKKDLK